MAPQLSQRKKPSPGKTRDVWEGIVRIAEQDLLKQGDQLPSVRDLARRLGVRPTSVRDALLQAQARGVVRIVPRIGAFLETTSPAARTLTGSLASAATAALKSTIAQESQNLLHLLDARRLIEVELAGRAAENRRLEDLLPARRALETLMRLPADAPRAEHVTPDIEFHTELAKLSGNTVLASIQNTLMELLRPYLLDVPPTAERRTIVDRSHASIYAAVAEGNAPLAREEMRSHLSLAYDSLLRDLQEPPRMLRSQPTTGR